MYTTLRKLALVAVVVLVLASANLLPVRAGAETVLTFDDLGLPNATEITDQYADQGVIFSPVEGVLLIDIATTPIFPEDPQCLFEIPFFTSVIIADFLPSASAPALGLTLGRSASAS